MNREFDDEIDLKPLLKDIIKHKSIFKITVVLSLLISILFVYINLDKKKVNLSFLPLTPSQVEKFRLYNSYDFVKNKVTSEYLYSEFQRLAETKKDFNKIISTEPYSSYFGFQDDKINNQLSRNFKILKSNNNESNNKLKNLNEYLKIEFEIKAPDEVIYEISNLIFFSINESVRTGILDTINSEIYRLEKTINYSLEDLQIKEKNLLHDYEIKTTQRLSFLKEQLSIARKMNIKENTLSSVITGNEKAIVAGITSESPFFYRGYIAIQEEIDLILSRTNYEEFIPELIDIRSQIFALKNTQDYKKVQFFLTSENLNQNNFLSTNFSINQVDIESKYNPLKIILAGLGFGFFFGFFIYVYKKIID